MISVVMPMRDAAATVGLQLSALAAQSYAGHWEMIVADNGSTDASVGIAMAWADRLPGFRLVDASAAVGSGGARNAGAATARGELLAFCDADDVVEPGWLQAFADGGDQWDLAAGAFDYVSLNAAGAAPGGAPRPPSPSVTGGWLPFAGGGNLAVRRAAFYAIGGFTRDFLYCQDVVLSWQLQLAGYRFAVVTDAVVATRARRSLGDLWSRHARHGRYNVALFMAFRAHGMPRPAIVEALRTYAWLVSRVPACREVSARREWVRFAAMRWGRIVGSVRARILCL